MKDCLYVLLPVITKIVNLSMTNGPVPTAMKETALSSFLKKSSVDRDQFPSYRPIFNLPFISKCTEKVVAFQQAAHVNDTNLSEIYLSAYKQGHRAETTFVLAHHDIMRVVDYGDCVILLLLNFSVA